MIKINKTEELEEKLNQENKIYALDSPSHIDAIAKMNEDLEEFRREYKVKDKNSQSSASNVVLTA